MVASQAVTTSKWDLLENGKDDEDDEMGELKDSEDIDGAPIDDDNPCSEDGECPDDDEDDDYMQ